MVSFYTVKRVCISKIIVVILSIFGASDINSAVAIKAKIFQKSLVPLYSASSANELECDACKTKKSMCHDSHTYCSTCDDSCEECPADCATCKSSQASDTECIICNVEYREGKEREVVLECNHSFGEKCINQWEREHKSCPMCRKVITYKICALCNDTVHVWEPSCTYECRYRWWGWESEKHIFHKRCIEPFARKTAFVSGRAINDIKTGDIVFHCPVKHKKGSGCSSVDLKILLQKVIPLGDIKNERFPSARDAENKELCNICHTAIKADQRKSSYTCKYRDTWDKRTDEHIFHTACLKPYAERNAYKQQRHGKDTGKIVFDCPCDHTYGVNYPDQGELEIALLPGFKAECVLHYCAVCDGDIEIEDPDTVVAEFDDFLPGFNLTKVVEKQYYHRACFGGYVAKYARQKATWGGSVKVVYPCPCHKDTSCAHDFELPIDVVVIEGK